MQLSLECGINLLINKYIRAPGSNGALPKSQAKMTSGMDDNKEIQVCKLYIYSNSPILRSCFVVPQQPYPIRLLLTYKHGDFGVFSVGTLRSDNGDVHENVAEKIDFASF